MISHLKRTLAAMICLLIAAASVLPVSAANIVAFFVGDVDMSQTISAEDARLALRMSVGLEKITPDLQKLADADGDGTVSSGDARIILRASVGLESVQKQVFIDVEGEDIVIPVDPGDPSLNIDSVVPDEELFEHIAPAAPEIKGESGTFTFVVYGNGHGVGMSQYGAIGMDKGGRTYDSILTHYFSGTVIEKTSYPEISYHPSTGNISTEEMVARMTYMEIYGITDGGKYIEAVKAQAVAIFTLLKYYNFRVSGDKAGVPSSKSYDSLPENLKTAVHEVMGEYLTDASDPAKRPIQTVYSAMAAGKTVSSKDVWGGYLSYLQSVESPFEMSLSGFYTVYTVSKSTMYNRIKNYDSSITLSDDPGQWLEIVEHTASIDENRGYVTKIRVGNKTINGPTSFCLYLMGGMRSSCFTVQYNY